MKIITEEQAIQYAMNINELDELYIFLSTKQANMISGQSTPYVGTLESGGKILFVFTSYERAKAYIDQCRYEVLDGIYTIGKLIKADPHGNLYSILNTALYMDITSIDIDQQSEDAFGCDIAWFMRVNKLEAGGLSILFTESELEQYKTEPNQELPIRFNPIAIEHFSDKYEITSERANVILHHIFEQGIDPLDNLFLDHESLHENCFVADYITTRCIPMARQGQKETDVEYFQGINNLIANTIWHRLGREQSLFTLMDQQGKIYIRDNMLYVIYTDRYKYMGKFEYLRIPSMRNLIELIDSHDLEGICVTDGIRWMTVIPKSVW